MLIYIIQFLVLYFLGFFIYPYHSNKKKKLYLLLSFCVLVFVSGFRAYTVGADTLNYISMFDEMGKNSRIEPGYIFYLYFLKLFSNNPVFFLFVSSCICIGVSCFFIYELSPDSVLSILLYVLLGEYFNQMNTMRQCLALSICMIALWYKIKFESSNRNYFFSLSFLLLIFATTIHASTIVVVISYILFYFVNKKINIAFRFIVLTICSSLIFFLVHPYLMRYIWKVFPQYQVYLNTTWGDVNYNASLFNTLIALTFACVGAFIYKKKILDYIDKYILLMISFSIVFNVLSMRMEIWGRVANLFNIYTYLIWAPKFTSIIMKKKDRFVLKNLIIFFSFLYMLIVLVYRPEWTCVVPYTTCFN